MHFMFIKFTFLFYFYINLIVELAFYKILIAIINM